MKLTSKILRKNRNFKEFISYVYNYWRPNTEAYIIIIKKEKNKLIDLLKYWFDHYPTLTITIGPFKDIYVYTYFDSNHNDQECVEFLFLYDSIIMDKMKTVHFTLGRDDYIDLS